MEFLNEYYVYVKALHYMAFVSWMAALFYLPRLFVYHTENKDNADFVKVIKVQERRLFKGIQVPAMLGSIITGVAMLYVKYMVFDTSSGTLEFSFAMPSYMHAKLTFAVLLLIYHFDTARYRKQLENDTCKRSGVFFRAYNEVPTLLFIGIVFSFAIAGEL